MKKLFLTLAISCSVLPLYALDCPQKQESAADCPWAGAARELDVLADRREPLEPVFVKELPGLLRQLDSDRTSPARRLWGESINFDELAGGTIVHPGILEFLAARIDAPRPRGKIVHAGMEHTYGYLFSLLPTKFGFKRARWVRPDIEDGLGLPRGSVGPSAAEGTLLDNVTCLAGGIALRDDPAAEALLAQVLPRCGTAVRAYASVPVRRGRLTEEVSLPGGRKVVLRTDFAPFKAVSGGNSHLLVYSVSDPAAGHAYLVTAFPVNKGFVDGVLAPSSLGKNKPVQTRYNAYVEGLTEAGKFKGTRSVAVVEK
jgi:hypothetical protein